MPSLSVLLIFAAILFVILAYVLAPDRKVDAVAAAVVLIGLAILAP